MPTKPEEKAVDERAKPKAKPPAQEDASQAEARKPTIYTTVALQLLATHLTGVQKASTKKGSSWSSQLGAAFGLYDQKLAAAKRWLIQMHLIGDKVGSQHVQEPDGHRKYFPMLDKMTYIDDRDRKSHEVCLSERKGLLSFTACATDELSKAALLNEIHLLNCMLGAAIDKIHRGAGAGGSVDAIRKANAITNTLYTYCGKLDLLDKEYDLTDPATMLFHAGLLYIGDRCEANDSVALSKIDKLVSILKRLGRDLNERRILDRVKYQSMHPGEEVPKPRLGYDLVLATIEELNAANVNICEEGAWNVSVPVSVSMFMPAVSIPLGLKPSEGKFKELMDFAKVAVTRQQSANPEHALYQEDGELYVDRADFQSHVACAM